MMNRAIVTALAAIAAILALAAGASGESNWPMYRGGPGHDGFALVDIPGQPGLQWSVAVTTTGSTSPVVSDARVFVAYDRTLVALSENDGSVLWRYNASDRVRADPAVQGSILLAITENGRLLALSCEKGALLWDAQLPAGKTYSSPLTVAESLYVTSDDGTILKVSIEGKGNVSWSSSVGAKQSGPAAVGAGTVFSVSQNGNVFARSADSGKALWTSDAGADLQDRYLLSYANNRLYMTNGGKNAQCLNASTGKAEWKSPLKSATRLWPAAGNGMVVYCSENGRMTVLDAVDGRDVWNATYGSKFSCAPVIAGHSVLTGLEDGRLLLVCLSNGTVIWSGNAGSAVTGSPAVAGSAVLVVTQDGHLLDFRTPEVTLPLAVLGVSTGNAVAGAALTFSASGSYDPLGKPVTYLFDFGDGTITDWNASETASHVYTKPGNYTASLKVRSTSGAESQRALWPVRVSPVPVPASPTPGISAPVATATISLVSLGLLGAALATETGKYKLLGLLLVPLYVRLKKDAVLDNYTRGKIHGYIIANPGDHYNSIRDALELSNGILAHHLHTLEREGLVQSVRDGMYRRFFPANAKLPPEDEGHFNIQKRVVAVIRANPGISQKEIAQKVGVSSPTVNYHINVLVTARMIRVEKQGRGTRCFVLDEPERPAM